MPAAINEGVRDKHILRAVFIVGAGGSGKTALARQMFLSLGSPGGGGFKDINPDKHVERLLSREQQQRMAQHGFHFLRERARHMKNKELRQYASRRLPLLLDTPGWSMAAVRRHYDKLQSLGYDCYLVIVDTSLDTALRRNKARAEAGGRNVPDSAIADAHKQLQQNIPALIRLFRPVNVWKIDNDEDMPAATWQATVAREARKIAGQILTRPLRNPLGKQWLKQEKAKPDPASTDPAQVYDDPIPYAFKGPAGTYVMQDPRPVPKQEPGFMGRVLGRAKNLLRHGKSVFESMEAPGTEPAPSLLHMQGDARLTAFGTLIGNAQADAVKNTQGAFALTPQGVLYRSVCNGYMIAVNKHTALPYIAPSSEGTVIVLPTEYPPLEAYASGLLMDYWPQVQQQLNQERRDRTASDLFGRLIDYLAGYDPEDEADDRDPIALIEQFEQAHNWKVVDAVSRAGSLRGWLSNVRGTESSLAGQLALMALRVYAETYVPDYSITDLLDEAVANKGVNKKAARALYDFIRKGTPELYISKIARPVSLWIANGKYDAKRAWKLPLFPIKVAAKALFMKVKSSAPYHSVYNPETREAVARALIASAEKEAKAGKYRELLPKKYQEGKK